MFCALVLIGGSDCYQGMYISLSHFYELFLYTLGIGQSANCFAIQGTRHNLEKKGMKEASEVATMDDMDRGGMTESVASEQE